MPGRPVCKIELDSETRQVLGIFTAPPNAGAEDGVMGSKYSVWRQTE